MLVKLCLCGMFSLYSCYTDWKEYKIRNWACGCLAAAGIAGNALCFGWKGLLSALGGGAVMLCLFPLFVLRMLGAGDVKALMAIGCVLGAAAAPRALISSLLGAGVAAVVVVAARKNAADRMRAFAGYLRSVLQSGTVAPYQRNMDPNGVFRFSYGIALGVLAMLAQELLKR